MSVNSSLDAMLAKLERSAFRIADIKYRMAMFFLNRPFRIRKSLTENGRKEIWYFELSGEVPLDFPVIAGEALHNLRSVLDQVCSLVAEKAGYASDGVYYPFGKSEEEFLKALRRQTKISVAHHVIKGARPFPGPDEQCFPLRTA